MTTHPRTIMGKAVVIGPNSVAKPMIVSEGCGV
jgi:hypothetical protein